LLIIKRKERESLKGRSVGEGRSHSILSPRFATPKGMFFFTHGVGEIGAHNSVPFRSALVAKRKSAAPQSKFKKNKNLSVLKSNTPNSVSR